MDNIIKLIVLKEEPKKVHREKLSDILNEAEFVAKEYVLKKYPDLWPMLQSDFKKQSDFKREREKFANNNIIDIEPKHLDVTNFTKLLQNAGQSPFCCKDIPKKPPSLYHTAWVNPDGDLNNKLKELQNKLRVNCSSMTSGEQVENDVKEILLCNVGDKICNISSYLWLLNEEKRSESLLSAHYNKNGVDGYLSVLKIAFPNFDINDYAYVNYLHILRDKRNSIHNVGEEFIPLVSYNKDYHVINQVIQNLFRLMTSTCNENVSKSKEIDDFRSSVQNRIENILSRTSYQTEVQTVYKEYGNSSSAIGTVLENISDISRSDSLTITDDDQKSSASKSVQETRKSDDPKESDKASTDVEKCKVCNVPVGKGLQMEQHEKGKHHLKKLNELNSAASAVGIADSASSPVSKQSSGALENEDIKKRAVMLTRNAFIDSFEPIPKPCASLRLKGVLSVHEHEKIRSEPKREDRVVEFLETMMTKHDFYEHLKEVLADGYKNLLKLLEANLLR